MANIGFNGFVVGLWKKGAVTSQKFRSLILIKTKGLRLEAWAGSCGWCSAFATSVSWCKAVPKSVQLQPI